MQTQTKQGAMKTAVCDRCGEDCASYQIRYYGPVDRETGYQDEEVVCADCQGAEEADYDELEEERYAEGDRQFTEMFEMGEI